MSYVISVGGDPINPNPFYYSQISLTASEALIWPSNGQSSTFVATSWIDITANNSGYIVTMPPANEAATGAEVVFYNYGSYTITINNSASGSITTIASGETKRIWITDNSTIAGTWRIANIGSGTTSADASMLAGYGIIAQAGQLSQSMPVTTFGTSATINAGYRAYLATWTGGSGTFTLASPVTLGNNWFVGIKNAGTGTLTVDGGGFDIDGQSTITAAVEEGFTVTTDGAAFYTTGRQTPDTSGYTFLSKSVTGSTDITLSAAESVYNIINFTGTLGASINVVTPSSVNEWIMVNSSTGSTYTLTVKTSGGTGEVLSQGDTRILYCDGTDVNFADILPAGGSVTSVATGTGLSGGPITVSGTISLTNTTVVAGAYGSASKSVIYTVDAQGRFTNSTDLSISITDANLSSQISVSKGGTSSTTLTLNNVILGNDTSAPLFVAPGTSGNVLTSDGTTWSSATPVQAATQADQETGSSTTTYVSPGRQQYHPSAAKAWCKFNTVGTTTITKSYNVSSLTDGGTGITTVNFSVAFSSANYDVNGNAGQGQSGDFCVLCDISSTAGASVVQTRRLGTVALDNCARVNVSYYGDQ